MIFTTCEIENLQKNKISRSTDKSQKSVDFEFLIIIITK